MDEMQYLLEKIRIERNKAAKSALIINRQLFLDENGFETKLSYNIEVLRMDKIKSSDILLSLNNKSLEVFKDSDNVCVQYRDAKIKDGEFLKIVYGMGENFESACDDYLNKIRRKTLVLDAFNPNCKEFIFFIG